MEKPKDQDAQKKIAKLEASVAAWRSKALSLRQQNANLINLVAGLADRPQYGRQAKRPPRTQ